VKSVTALLALATVVGCDPTYPDTIALDALTSPPFGSKGSITTNETLDSFHVNMSVGVALAAGCWDSCYEEELCTVTAANPAVLGVRPLYRIGATGNQFVLVAQTVGATMLHVETQCAARDYFVEILGP
jgi:hypothetical protein